MVRHGIELDSEAIREFCRKWRVKGLWAFGSILRDDFRPDSDIDLLIEWDKRSRWDICDHMDMEAELAGILGRKVDLVARGAVEMSPNRFRRKEILTTAEPVIAQR